MSSRRHAALAIALALALVTTGCMGNEFGNPKGANVADQGIVEAFTDADRGVIYYFSQAAGEGNHDSIDSSSVDCERTGALPSEYPGVSELDQFVVIEDDAADAVCYLWKKASATDCIPTNETTASGGGSRPQTPVEPS